MDGVSSAFAVVSLALQLVETVHEISKFLKEIENAPTELTRLVETLDQLNSVLGYVKDLLEQQFLVLRLPGSPAFILQALKNCQGRVKTLETLVNKASMSFGHHRRVPRTWASVRFISKKEDFHELQSQLRDAKSDLQFAISSNSWQLQMHHLQITNASVFPVRTPEDQSSLDMLPTSTKLQHNRELGCDRLPSKQNLPLIAQETNTEWYHGIFGNIRIHRKAKYSSQSLDRAMKKKALVEENFIMISPAFMRRGFEFGIISNFGKISRTLNVYPVMMKGAPIFQMCRKGDMQGLQAAFSSGNMSPFVLDNYGRTLLHHAAQYFRADLCSWLLGLGVDPDRPAHNGIPGGAQTALQRVGILGVCFEYGGDLTSFTKEIVDTLRVLAQAQVDFSTSDMKGFTSLYSGPPEGLEFIYLQQCVQAGFSVPDDELSSAMAFATALSQFGKGLPQWEHLIRTLIHKGVDIHGRVRQGLIMKGPAYAPETGIEPQYWCERGTPLDQLFEYTDTPIEANAVGDAWLEILSTEEYDVVTYLKQEIALHATQQQLTYTEYADDNICRQLVFQLEGDPRVSWDWRLDPRSSASLVREEYKQMNLSACQRNIVGPTPWEDIWPFDYPQGSWIRYPVSDHHAFPKWERRYNRAQERAHRRMKKKGSKLARAQRVQGRSKMPGAWPI